MKRLNKDHQAERDRLRNLLQEKSAAIESAWGDFEGAHETLVNAVDEYNGAIQEVAEWRDGIVSEMQDYYDERSERWQEGDAGQEYDSWKDEWENGDFEELETPELPDQPEGAPAIDAIDNLPDEPG